MFIGLLVLTLAWFIIFKITNNLPLRKISPLFFLSLLFLYPYNLFILNNCSGDCSIRIDILFLLPITLIYIVVMILKMKKAPKN